LGGLAAAYSLYKAIFFTASHVRIGISTTVHVRISIRYSTTSHMCCAWTCFILWWYLYIINTHLTSHYWC